MVSIELCHIYTDESIDKEKNDSINILTEIINKNNYDYKTCVLIDDYTPEAYSLIQKPILNNSNSIKDYLVSHGINDTFITYESYLIPLCWQVLNDLQNQDKKKYKRLIEKNQKMPCSLFVISWYLIRLGHISHKNFPIEPSEKIINILPMRFKEIDDIVLGVLKRSKNLNSYVNKIESIYFESTNPFIPKI